MTAARRLKHWKEQLGQGYCLPSQLRWPSSVISIAGRVLHTCMLCSCKAARGAIFQESEESFAGAKAVVDSGVLKGVTGVHGLHVWPSLQTGVLASRVSLALPS